MRSALGVGMPRPRVLGLATAVPTHVLDQDDVVAEAAALFAGRHSELERLLPVFENTGIRTRHSVRPHSWFQAAHGWPDRTEAYLEGGTDLFVRAAEGALAAAGRSVGDVDTVVTVSSTGIATPSLEARVHGRLGL